MAGKSNLVNLDAMIKREDFATVSASSGATFDTVGTISIRDFTPGGMIGPSLRKPDFQRETNHWSPEQVVSLLDCFVNGDLIPSVILWQSPTYVFVIDGGHRLSALRAWVEDDYGDGPVSQSYFGFQVSEEQRKVANRTRELVAKKVGTWQHYLARSSLEELDHQERIRLTTIVTRGLPIQWVKGDADRAEQSFFRINTKGTALDDVEELLLRTRQKPVSIASRAVIRAGKGHKYWSKFPGQIATQIETSAKNVHAALFEPEIQRPVKTLDLPLAGPKGVRTALEVLIELILISIRNQNGEPKKVDDLVDDTDGQETLKVLSKTYRLVRRVTGNDQGSLGLHPAVYFYGPTGRHSSPMFMGTLSLIAKKLANNDDSFFMKFTRVRASLESLLISHKDLIATILQRLVSTRRIEQYSILLDKIILALIENQPVTDDDLVHFAGLEGRVITAKELSTGKTISDDVKSGVFIQSALSTSLKCPICSGYLDPDKSLSYDHVTRVRDGGLGTSSNVQLTHPYCNQSVKC